LNGPDALLADKLVKEVDDVLGFASKKAETFRVEADRQGARSEWTIFAFLVGLLLAGIGIALLITRSVYGSLKLASGAVRTLARSSEEKVLVAETIAAGDLSRDIAFAEALSIDPATLPKDQLGQLMGGVLDLSNLQSALDRTFQRMTTSLRLAHAEEARTSWLKSGLNDLNNVLRGEQENLRLTDKAICFLAPYLGAGVGAMYIFHEATKELRLVASYAYARPKQRPDRFRLGEGLIGQAALEGRLICLPQVPADYFTITSALGERSPQWVIAIPFHHEGQLIGALELGTFRDFNPTEMDFLVQAMESVATAIAVNLARQQVNELLAQSQQQEEELRVQQEELQQSNEELEERAQLLEQQREQNRAANVEMKAASLELQRKAAEVERVSTYKSEFLANMSHELRTPLNSLMILSRLLMENKEGNLTDKQVEFSSTIHGAGKDLLNLINDILDLSKIESGHMEYQYEEAPVAELYGQIGSAFRAIAEQKGLRLEIEVAPEVPPTIRTDNQRCLQILKNLLSNAIKFTSAGAVVLRAYVPDWQENPLPVPAIAFSVRDTGIGIPAHKHELVFQAFQQADGTTSRTYGGTGLGLSISRQLALGMGGEIRLASEEGQGSLLTLYLPVAGVGAAAPLEARFAPTRHTAPQREPVLVRPGVPDDREGLEPGGKAILIVEDDLPFAGILVDMVRERGFAAIATAEGPEALVLAERYLPSAIILDVMLPGMDGWAVMQKLTDNLRTRHIPVHFLTCLDERQKALSMGAVGYAMKPVSRESLDALFTTLQGAVSNRVRRLLIVEDDPREAKSLLALLEGRELQLRVAETGAEAIRLLSTEPFDCMVLDLGLSDMSGFDLLEHIQLMDAPSRIPVIIHSGRDLSRADEARLQQYARSIIIKGAKSPERLLNEVTLFLHVLESNLSPEKVQMIHASISGEMVLEGKKVLIVDDDMRNVFSLTSLLTDRGMKVVEAENGREGLARLNEHPDVAIVLMDVMMPEMNGYEAIQALRQDARFAKLPVIALTAKAMKGDREACMEAGASDYITKPIDLDRLLSMLRVWLYGQF
jgi:CheY-like chemotaxis protein